jgi:hypothetical protein
MGEAVVFVRVWRLALLAILLCYDQGAWAQARDGRYRRGRPGDVHVGRDNRKGQWVVLLGGGALGFWLAGWKIRSANKQLKQKLEKEYKGQEKRAEDHLKTLKYQYQDFLSMKETEYTEKLKHLNYLENALTEAGIPIEIPRGADIHSSRVQQDYEEFKQPDANNDGKISKREFDHYMRQYLQANPEYTIHDYPSFEEFDTDRDGYVVFQEWQDYLNEQYKAESADPYYYSSSYGTQGRKK